MQLYCWFGVKKIIDVSGNRTDPSFLSLVIEILCLVLKVFQSQPLIQFIRGWIQWNNAV